MQHRPADTICRILLPVFGNKQLINHNSVNLNELHWSCVLPASPWLR